MSEVPQPEIVGNIPQPKDYTHPIEVEACPHCKKKDNVIVMAPYAIAAFPQNCMDPTDRKVIVQSQFKACMFAMKFHQLLCRTCRTPFIMELEGQFVEGIGQSQPVQQPGPMAR